MNKQYKGFFLILIVTVLMLSLIPAISFAASLTSPEKTDTKDLIIESKAKTVKYKITWNGNSGKFGNKKTMTTTVKKGSKIGKLVATPKRTGYALKGWYTKKSGGKKISVNSKPSKNIVLYAQWTKKVSTSTNSKLIGSWQRADPNFYTGYIDTQTYTFNKNGKFAYMVSGPFNKKTGNYKVSNGKITFTNIVATYSDGIKRSFPSTIVAEYQFVSFNGQEHLKIRPMDENITYYSIPVISFIKLQSKS